MTNIYLAAPPPCHNIPLLLRTSSAKHVLRNQRRRLTALLVARGREDIREMNKIIEHGKINNIHLVAYPPANPRCPPPRSACEQHLHKCSQQQQGQLIKQNRGIE